MTLAPWTYVKAGERVGETLRSVGQNYGINGKVL